MNTLSLIISDILDDCVALSSYEGRRLTDGSGNSLYEVVHITTQDTDFVTRHILTAADMLFAHARYVLRDMEVTGTAILFSYEPSSGIASLSNREKLIREILSSHAMMLWLADKSPERSEAYKLMTENLLASFDRSAHRKVKPNLEDY